MEQLWNDNDSGKAKYLEKMLFQYKKSDIAWPGIEPRPLRLDTFCRRNISDWPVFIPPGHVTLCSYVSRHVTTEHGRWLCTAHRTRAVFLGICRNEEQFIVINVTIQCRLTQRYCRPCLHHRNDWAGLFNACCTATCFGFIYSDVQAFRVKLHIEYRNVKSNIILRLK